MATSYTSLLGLALPVTGELSGTWGDTVNNAITSLLDTAVAGTTTLSTDGDVTLTTTTGASNQARQAILLCSGARTALRTITAPAQSKIYTIINATSGGYSVKLVGSGPTTGLTIPNGASAVVAWNGSDFIEIGSGTIGNLTVNGNLAVTGTTTLTGAFTANGNSTLGDAVGDTVTINGTATFVNANPTLSAGTANGVAYLNGSKVLATGSALTFDGTNLGLQSSTNAYAGGRNGATFRANSASGFEFILQSTSATAGTSTGFATAVTGNDVYFVNRLDGFYSWITGSSGNAEQMRLTSTGLGIGTSSPGYKLDVLLGAGSGNIFRAGQSGVSNGYTITTSGSALTHIWANGGSDAMRLDSSGNLGLGVTPSAWLSSVRAMQIGGAAGLWSSTSATNNSAFESNTYLNSAANPIYIGSSYATRYQQYNGQHIFYTAPSGTAGNAISFTQAMTLDASGNLGVGTTSPGYRLDVQGSGSEEAIRVRTTASSGDATLYMSSYNATPGNNVISFGDTGSGGSGQIIYAHSNDSMQFKTAGTERARIESSGNLLVGGTSSVTGRIQGFSANTSSIAISAISQNSGDVGQEVFSCRKFDNNSTTSQVFQRFTINNGAAGCGQINANGANSAAFGSFSDRRLKENIQDLPPQLANIMALRPVEFDYIASEGGGHQTGFVAQEMQEVYPDAVGERAPDGMLTITGWSKTEARLVKAIQELKAEFDAYKATHP